MITETHGVASSPFPVDLRDIHFLKVVPVALLIRVWHCSCACCSIIVVGKH